ncbi:hypothetical protein B7494_g4473 [Chlorociboria aeruginascens]|nr:hypothetical protein B7494_g4473 [Chlorociboria aeruginascens]
MSKVAYTMGQEPETLQALLQRTVADCASYLVPYLKCDFRLLDVGCGPGSISCDFANILSHGSVIGIDQSPEAVAVAKKTAFERGIGNISFQTADVTRLPFEDATFDVVHAHQVLIHIPTDLVPLALKEIKRVMKPGGVVGFRDGIWDSWAIYPGEMKWWVEMTGRVMDTAGSDRNAGMKLHAWVREAGFQVVLKSSSCVFRADQEPRKAMAALITTGSSQGKKAMEFGFCGEEELHKAYEAWKKWADHEDGWMSFMCGEVVGRM